MLPIPSDLKAKIDAQLNKTLLNTVSTPAFIDSNKTVRLFTDSNNELAIFKNTADLDIFIANKFISNEININDNTQLLYVPLKFYVTNRVLFNRFINGKQIKSIYSEFISQNCNQSNLNINDSMSSFISVPIMVKSAGDDPIKLIKIFEVLEKSPELLLPCFSCGTPCHFGDMEHLGKDELAAALFTVEKRISYCPGCVVKKFAACMIVKAKTRNYAIQDDINTLLSLPEPQTVDDITNNFRIVDDIKDRFHKLKSQKNIKPWMQ